MPGSAELHVKSEFERGKKLERSTMLDHEAKMNACSNEARKGQLRWLRIR
jgi:hypothetical protein